MTYTSSIINKSNYNNNTIEPIKDNLTKNESVETKNESVETKDESVETKDESVETKDESTLSLDNDKLFYDEKWKMLRIIGGRNIIPSSLKCFN